VGLLGGSFDPVHLGHLRAAEWSLEAFGLDTMLLVPARRSPLKEAAVARDEDRLAMVKLAIADNPRFVMESCEMERAAPSYMVDTLRTLKGRSPGDHLVLILGSDAARDLDKWRQVDEVLRLAELRVLARPGERAGADASVFAGLAISSSGIRRAVLEGRSIRYLTPESVRLYIEERRLYK
jgi:nicotinate-nucleotide adenylyltransferase